ncbi:MAG TPA: hypothetical protein VGP63_13535 [Planctomycetaceae bacterium]|jgi:hypothetical protein|nr:hypothetical protein [Planctomycetaceae bacterium]
MATRAAERGNRSFRISPTLLVLACTTLMAGILVFVTYRRGAATDTEMRFLFTWLAPDIDEASALCPVEYALRTADGNDVIFLGDSTCRTGVDPARFETLTGLSAYNLGSLRGIGAAGFVITAKAYLLHHPKPRALVLCVTPTCFEVEAGTVGGPLSGQFVSNYGPEVAEFVPLIARVSYFSKRGVWSVWPRIDVAKERMHGQDVRDVPLRGYKTETYHSLQRKTRESRGFFALPGLHGPPKGIGGAEATLVQDEWDQGIRRLAQVCDAADVALLIQFTPVTAQVAAARDFGPLETWSQGLESTYKRLTVARPIVLVYEPQDMWDYIHLNAAGVERFVPLVAKNVQASLKE